MKTLIKYLLIGFIAYVTYSNWDGIVDWYKSDGREIKENVEDAVLESGEELVEKGKKALDK